jgi:AmmeMemoRadiSam system protein B/AmmeMemoRadiSam system protein A
LPCLLFFFFVSIFIFSCAKAGEQPKENESVKKESESYTNKNFQRSAAVSGQFYPASAKKLKNMVTQFLESSPLQKDSGQLIGLICPHAGYIYSGEVAAHSYKLLEGKKIRTVILIGPSHRFPLKGVSVWSKGAYQTPLGEAEIDEQMAAKITNASDDVAFHPHAHLQEHSLEVQIPFLQVILNDFRIVPVLIGRASHQTLKDIGQALASILKDPTVILIISSDLSHYHPYEEAVAIDKDTLEAIQTGDCEKFKVMVENGTAELCGEMPVLLLLETIRSMNRPANIKLLKYANSGDTAGMMDRVVGYAALSITIPESKEEKQSDLEERGEKKLAYSENLLNEQEKEKLLKIARESITLHLKGENLPKFEVTEPRLQELRGVFVTLHKKGMLRGCIGYIKPFMPLYKATSDCAISAAVKDYRFSPLQEDELDEIDIEISALTPLQKINDIDQIKVGEHGLYISRSPYSGLLLPQVATEYGWNRETFLAQTCRKAGLPEDAWEKGADIYIFSAQIFGEKER